MSHSFTKIWLHLVFATKERKPLIEYQIEQKIYNYMTEQLIASGCLVRIINGMPDHIHLLFLLNPQKPVSDIVKQLKGSSSHWINQNDLIQDKFSWQNGYSVFSASESQVEKIYYYILNQKQHHKKKTFVQEHDEFNQAHGLISK